VAKVKYKSVSKNLEKITKPSDNTDSRSSIGQSITITEYYELDISRLIPFKNQAREAFSDQEIQSLSQSIIRHGIRQPLTVIKSEVQGKYEVVSGERRLRASVLAGLKKVPCIIIEDSSMSEEIAVVENIMRTDLHPLELSKAFCSLLENNKNLKQKEVASRIGVSESFFSEILKYNTLPSDVKRILLEKNIKERDFFRKLLRTNNPMSLLNETFFSPSKKNQSSNVNVLRVFIKDGEIKVQSGGLINLTHEQKNLIKIELSNLLY